MAIVKELKKGSVVYQLRHGVAELKLVIEEVKNDAAYCGSIKFNSKYIESNISVVNSSIWTTQTFGITFAVPTLENIDVYEREITLRYIRNADFSMLTLSEVLDIKNRLIELLNFKKQTNENI